jgi:hypothetical protein
VRDDRAGFWGALFAASVLICYGIYWYAAASDCSAMGGVLVSGSTVPFECVEGKK